MASGVPFVMPKSEIEALERLNAHADDDERAFSPDHLDNGPE
jgi:hypothetical protein